MPAKRKTLFDPTKARGGRSAPDVGASRRAEKANSRAISVSALVGRIKGALLDAFPERLCVVGEISNLSAPVSGHLYFSLKDSGATIGAAMWRGRASKLKFQPTDGMEVVVEGKVDVYDVQGKVQLYVERMTPAGVGALELAFRQLVEKLSGEGLFDPACKKPIPRFPRAVGVVTSATGAAIRDIQRTIQRRWAATEVFLLPATVQGEGAGDEIARAVRLLDANAGRLGIDTIIVTRGGGSLEDLWAFNEEVLGRAIFAAKTPIISGVGHEVDVTICDMVADVRAPTPTAAAEQAVPDGEEIRRTLRGLSLRLGRNVRDTLTTRRTGLESILRSAIFRDPAGRVRSYIQRVDKGSHRLRASLHARLGAGQKRLQPLSYRLGALHPARLVERSRGRLEALVAHLRWVLGGRSKQVGDALAEICGRFNAVHPVHRLNLGRQRLAAAGKQLQALSYRSVLERGFSVTRRGDGKVIRSVKDVHPIEQVETELADGKFRSDVVDAEDVTPNNKPHRDPMDVSENVPKKKKQRRKLKERGPSLFD